MFIQSARRGTKRLKCRREEVQLNRKSPSFCLYSYLLADINIWILCSTLLKIVHATHPAPTRRGTHHYTLHASRFMCGCTVWNSLINLLRYFWYIVRSDAVGRLYRAKYCINNTMKKFLRELFLTWKFPNVQLECVQHSPVLSVSGSKSHSKPWGVVVAWFVYIDSVLLGWIWITDQGQVIKVMGT